MSSSEVKSRRTHHQVPLRLNDDHLLVLTLIQALHNGLSLLNGQRIRQGNPEEAAVEELEADVERLSMSEVGPVRVQVPVHGISRTINGPGLCQVGGDGLLVSDQLLDQPIDQAVVLIQGLDGLSAGVKLSIVGVGQRRPEG